MIIISLPYFIFEGQLLACHVLYAKNFSQMDILDGKCPNSSKNDVGGVQQRHEDAAKKKQQLHRQWRYPHLVLYAAAVAAVAAAAAAAAAAGEWRPE